MKRNILLIAVMLLGMLSVEAKAPKSKFVTVQGKNLVRPDGSKLLGSSAFLVGRSA